MEHKKTLDNLGKCYNPQYHIIQIFIGYTVSVAEGKQKATKGGETKKAPEAKHKTTQGKELKILF